MYHHVLVPVDCSNDSRHEAELVARYLAPMIGTKVTIAANITPSHDAAIRADKVRHAEKALGVIADIMTRQAGIHASRRIVEGAEAACALAHEARSVDEQYDLFVLGIHQTRPDMDDFPFRSSFSDQLAQRSHLPIMILTGRS